MGRGSDATRWGPAEKAETDRRTPTLFKSILVPTDGSDLTAKAVEQAIVFAKEIGAKITAMTVTEPFPPHLGSVASSELEYAPIEYMKHAKAYAETMASHGRRGVSAVVLGSETVKVLTHSKIPVLVYR